MNIQETASGLREGRRDGITLPLTMALLLIAAIATASVLTFSQSQIRTASRWRRADQCFLSAQTALESAKAGMYASFRSNVAQRANQWRALDWFDTYTARSVGSGATVYTLPAQTVLYGGTASVSVVSVTRSDFVTATNALAAEVTLASWCTNGPVVRGVQEVVRFGLKKSAIFDYAYFVNNFGYFWGTGVRANGDVRANGNMSLNNQSLLNGDAYASPNPEIGAAGVVEISGGWWQTQSLANYYATADDAARPGSPTHPTEGSAWVMGYDTNTQAHAYSPPLEMPYLGRLEQYETLATNLNGRITQKNQVLVDKVYAGAGPDGVAGTPDDGVMVLDGTKNPIVVEGAVVVRGDLIIKGTVTGQGCIYVGRNLHVAGNIEYADPPEWTKPDKKPLQTAMVNRNKDMVGLAAKGNIVLGDYTSTSWYNSIQQYMSPSFVNGYATDPTDYDLGYDSDRNPSNGHFFSGDYRANDGGKRRADNGSLVNRRYYEASVAPAVFQSIVSSSPVSSIDAVLYSNHLVVGSVGDRNTTFTLNGSIICRDDAILYNRDVQMNWDVRLGSRSREGIDTFFYFPMDFWPPETVQWRELP